MITKNYTKLDNFIIKPNASLLLEEAYPESTLYDLYDEINKMYFHNELPDIKIYYSKLAQKTLGRAKVDFSTSEMSIMVAYSIADDYTMLKNVVCHEMIHIWQYTMDIKEGTRQYSSPDFIEYILKSEDKGHNKYFKQWMNDFNKQGFLITITQDGFLEIEMSQTAYGIYIVSGGYHAILWNTYDFNPEDILKQYQDRFFDNVDSYTYFKTNNENIFYFTRLSTKGIRKNSKNIFVDPVIGQEFLKKAGVILDTVTIQSEGNEEDKETYQKVQAVLLQAHKYAIEKQFEGDYGYLHLILMNVYPELTRMKRKDVESWIKENVSEAILDLIKDDWNNVKVKDMSKIDFVLIHYLAPFNKRGFDSNEQGNLVYSITRAGLYDRFTVEEIYEGFIYYLEREIKKFIKKYGDRIPMLGDEDTTSKLKDKELRLAHKIAEINDIYNIISRGKK